MNINVTVTIEPSEKAINFLKELIGKVETTVPADTNGQEQTKTRGAGRPKKEDQTPAAATPVVPIATKGITLEELRAYGNKVTSTPALQQRVKELINSFGAANLKTTDPKNYAAIWEGIEKIEKEITAEESKEL